MSQPGTKILITTRDGFPLTARFFEPKEEPKATVVIANAMGVAQGYYGAFAQWLSENGFLAVTFDYRGTGESGEEKIRDIDIDILGWGRLDADTVLNEVLKRTGSKPLYWIGHSLGGQIIPLLSQVDRITKIVTVATGNGYWRINAPKLKRRVWWLWYFVVPVITPIFGYFPGKRLRKVGSLPRNVMYQWRRWCLDPEYAVGVEGPEMRAKFAAVKTPITSLSLVDDELMSDQSITSIHGFYTSAPKKMIRIRPSEIGEKQIGHFGFFRRRFAESLWKAYLLPELLK